MKKIFFILLFISSICSAQVSSLCGVIASSTASCVYDIDACAYFNACPNPLSDARKVIIDSLVVRAKRHGWWTKVDDVLLLANTTSGNGLINLIHPGTFTGTLVNSPSFVADQGFTGDGATNYINTNYNAFTSGTNYTLNDCSLGAYDIGVRDGGATQQIAIITRLANLFIVSVNDASAFNGANSDSRGLFTGIRTGASATASYKNGSSFATGSSASSAIPNFSAFVLALNSGGGGVNYSTKQIAIVFFGSSGIDQSLLSNDLNAYMTSLGTNVY
jgi:hypothetical protein